MTRMRKTIAEKETSMIRTLMVTHVIEAEEDDDDTEEPESRQVEVRCEVLG